MIVRIMGEGQREVDDIELGRLNELDNEIERAVEAGDEAQFSQALARLHDRVREVGRPLPDEALVPSDVVLPPDHATIDEVRHLFEAEGLVPGR